MSKIQIAKPAIYQIQAENDIGNLGTKWGWVVLAELADAVQSSPRDVLLVASELRSPEWRGDALHFFVGHSADGGAVRYEKIDLWPPSVGNLTTRLVSFCRDGEWVIKDMPLVDYLSRQRVFIPAGLALAVIAEFEKREKTKSVIRKAL